MIKGIYKITNLINGKSYIGQSSDPNRRFISHLSRARTGQFTEKQEMYLDILKYGEENFSMQILEWTDNYDIREQECIIEFGTFYPNGYNILPGGNIQPHYYGMDHHNCIVSEENLDIIINELKRGVLTETQIGNLFIPPYNQSLIHNINFGITHKRISETYPIRVESPYHLNTNDVNDIIWLLENTAYPMNQIADHYGVNVSTIKHISSGRNYYDQNRNYPLRKIRGMRQSQPVETILANRSTPTIDT